MLKGKIAFISIDKIVNNVMAEQLNEIFGAYYEIKKILLAENQKIDVDDCVLAVCSSISIVENVRARLTKNIPIIGSKRTLNMMNSSEINGIESDTAVIVVSNSEASAIETIKILTDIGFTHIDFIPYYTGCGKPITDIAITPGGVHTVPAGVKRIIDLGVKITSIATIIEIFSRLEMPIRMLDVVLEKNKQDIISANQYNSEMNSYLHGIFEVIHDGVAAFDKDGRLTLCSKNFSEMVGMNYIDVLSKNVQDIFENRTTRELVSKSENVYDEIIDCNSKRLLINKRGFLGSSRVKGFVISLQDITIIQNLENKVRKKISRKGFVSKYTFEDVIGESEIIKSNILVAKKMAESDFSVLIQGNNGTGKEIFAQAIHNNSKRKAGPFIAVNLASLSDDLIESELFGYEEGAFTGAMQGGKKGLFEMAHNGTIFIDEIGDVSQRIQQRLLRVLQEKEILKIGGNSIVPVDTRIIAASNVDLFQSVQEKKFRMDLYYRLNILQFKLPDLKERLDDIELLAKYFFKTIKSDKFLSRNVLHIFKQYTWPGNVRELENIVYYFDSIVENEEITEADLPEFFLTHISKTGQIYSDEISDYFTNERILKDCIDILHIMNQFKNRDLVLSRKTIKNILGKNQIELSMEQIRNRTEKLSKFGLIYIGKTKQGSRITAKGIEFISQYVR